jgi:hypothetical protein
MTADDFRRIALALPGAAEHAHMSHPDFRVGKRIFATLFYRDPAWAMVKLNLEQRRLLTEAEPDIFAPVKGGWGKNGATLLRLDRADEATAASALRMAWGNLA